MKESVLPLIKGLVALFLFLSHTIFWCTCIFILTIFKLLIPIHGVRHSLTKGLHFIASKWIDCNSLIFTQMSQIDWRIHSPPTLSNKKSYLLISNHLSAVDIVALQHVLNHQVPFLKFFIKSQLRFVPLLGFAWWALDFPFMKRYSAEELKKHPEKKGQDIATTKKMCERFKGIPTCIVNFVEGTRLTEKKLQEYRSSYRHLLPPKTGGVAFALEAMGDQFSEILDVTIFYPQGQVTLAKLFCGQIKGVTVDIRTRAVPKIAGSYMDSSETREDFKGWMASLWQEKDLLLNRLHRGHE